MNILGIICLVAWAVCIADSSSAKNKQASTPISLLAFGTSIALAVWAIV